MTALLIVALAHAQEHADVCEDWLQDVGLERYFSSAFDTDHRCPYMESAEQLHQQWAEALNLPPSLSQPIRQGCGLSDVSKGGARMRCFIEVVAVHSPQGDTCSGTLVAPGVVLTAKHCLPADTVTFTGDLRKPAAVYSVLRQVPHPERRVDAGLLILNEVPPVSPMIWRIGRAPAPDSPLAVAGFGLVNDGLSTTLKSAAALDPIETANWGCPPSLARAYRCRSGHEAVIIDGSGRDTCPGDSGGPLMEPIGEEWRLIGVTSRAVNGSTEVCGEGGVYVRVDVISDWMVDEIRKSSRFR